MISGVTDAFTVALVTEPSRAEQPPGFLAAGARLGSVRIGMACARLGSDRMFCKVARPGSDPGVAPPEPARLGCSDLGLGFLVCVAWRGCASHVGCGLRGACTRACASRLCYNALCVKCEGRVHACT